MIAASGAVRAVGSAATQPASTKTWWDGFIAFFTEGWSGWAVIGQVLLIVVVTLALRWVLSLAIRKVVQRIVTSAKSKTGTTETTELYQSPIIQARLIQRTQTLGSVLNSLVTFILVSVAVISILDAFHFNIGALVASAGLLGAAIGFGAQNLIKDLVSGMFIVFEDQYGVGDVVDLGSAVGVVENVGLRVTQVKDAEGTLWFVRNGEILRVGNHSQGWSRAIVDVDVPSSMDYEVVQSALLTAANRLTHTPRWARRLTGQPEVWGIDTLNGDSMVIKLAIKTRGNRETEVSRELRKQIKYVFAEQGILMHSTATAAPVIQVLGKEDVTVDEGLRDRLPTEQLTQSMPTANPTSAEVPPEASARARTKSQPRTPRAKKSGRTVDGEA